MSEVPFWIWIVLVNALTVIACLREFIRIVLEARRQDRGKDLTTFSADARSWFQLAILSIVFGWLGLLVFALFFLWDALDKINKHLFSSIRWLREHPSDPMNHEDFLT